MHVCRRPIIRHAPIATCRIHACKKNQYLRKWVVGGGGGGGGGGLLPSSISPGEHRNCWVISILFLLINLWCRNCKEPIE